MGTAQQLTKVNIQTITLTGVNIQLSDKVTCLGVLTDRQLSFVTKLAGSCFYQLQQLRVMRRTLSTDAAKDTRSCLDI